MFLISCGFTGGKGTEEADGVLALADSNTWYYIKLYYI